MKLIEEILWPELTVTELLAVMKKVPQRKSKLITLKRLKCKSSVIQDKETALPMLRKMPKLSAESEQDYDMMNISSKKYIKDLPSFSFAHFKFYSIHCFEKEEDK